jgi:hypothetical protein
VFDGIERRKEHNLLPSPFDLRVADCLTTQGILLSQLARAEKPSRERADNRGFQYRSEE